EIGEINDHIQNEAGHNANIIMGVGEDDGLGDAIAVTVIATGFNAEQQHEIVNTEAKKIIHTLEDEQKAERNLFSNQRNNAVNQIQEPETPAAPEPVVRHTLEEEENESSMELVSTTEIIKNMNVIYEEVNFESEEDFIIIDTTAEIRDIEVQQPEVVKPNAQQQTSLAFDMPLDGNGSDQNQQEEQSKVVTFDIKEDVQQYDVKDAVEVVPVTEVSEDGTKRYSLDDYMEVEDRLNNAKPTSKKQEPVVEKELQFEKRV